METTNVTISPCGGVDALLCVYPRQVDPQSCYIWLDVQTGSASATYNAEVGNAVPARQYHGLVRTFGIPLLRGDTCNALLEELRPLLQRVLDGAEVVWDGNNHVGRLSEDAQAAEIEIEAQCEALDSDLHWASADDWMYEAKRDIRAALAAGRTLD